MKPVGKEKTENSGQASNENTNQESGKSINLDLSKIIVEPLFEDMVDFDTFSKSDFRVVKVKACEEVPKSNKLLQFTLDDGSGTDRKSYRASKTSTPQMN